MIHVCFLIRSLRVGGAERQLVELVTKLDKNRFRVSVITFYDKGPLRAKIEAEQGVKLFSLCRKGRWDLIFSLWRFFKLVQELKPQILHGYTGVANELCLFVGKVLRSKVVWGLRAARLDLTEYGWLPQCLFRIGAWLSPFADLIIVNSYAGKAYHRAKKYCDQRMLVIPNGIDTAHFAPNEAAGQSVRAEWELPQEKLLVGQVARIDPTKDYPTFLAAASLLAKERDDVRFVCVGRGDTKYADFIKQMSRNMGLDSRLFWVNTRNDMCAVYNAMDVLTSSSRGEGFSNTIAEAMACGTPCVVTDVGDSAWIVGDTGSVVPAGSPEELVSAWKRLLNLSPAERKRIGSAARERICTHFNVGLLAERTSVALENLLA